MDADKVTFALTMRLRHFSTFPRRESELSHNIVRVSHYHDLPFFFNVLLSGVSNSVYIDHVVTS